MKNLRKAHRFSGDNGSAVSSPRFTTRRTQGDRGATLAIVAILLVSVLAMAGFAVDIGVAYNARRMEQSSVDSGALAGAIGSRASGTSGAARRYVAGVYIRYQSYQNLDNKANYAPTPFYWNARWQTCTDPLRPASYNQFAPASAAIPALPITWSPLPTTSSQCISFSTGLQRMRVKMPSFPVNTSFAKMVGVNSWNASAVAEVEFGFDQPFGTLPFGVPIGDGVDGLTCLKDQASLGTNDVCGAQVTGNFGKLDFSLFGNTQLGNTFQCAPTNGSNRVAFNTMYGVDHPLGLLATDPLGSSTPPGGHTDKADCDAGRDWLAHPNGVRSDTGNTFDPVENGFLEGLVPAERFGLPQTLASIGPCAGLPAGRLGAGKVFATKQVWTGTVRCVEDTPLWYFMSPGLVQGTPSAINTNQVPFACLNFDDNGYAWLDSTAFGGRVLPGLPNVVGVTIANKSMIHMARCLDELSFRGYTAAHVFWKQDGNGRYEIMDSQRFGFTPLTWGDTLGNGTSGVFFKERLAVFVQTTYHSCSGNSCDGAFNPGETCRGDAYIADIVSKGGTTQAAACPIGKGAVAIASNKSLQGVSAFTFQPGFKLLPDDVYLVATNPDTNVYLIK